jgi:hypothetical protein
MKMRSMPEKLEEKLEVLERRIPKRESPSHF